MIPSGVAVSCPLRAGRSPKSLQAWAPAWCWACGPRRRTPRRWPASCEAGSTGPWLPMKRKSKITKKTRTCTVHGSQAPACPACGHLPPRPRLPAHPASPTELPCCKTPLADGCPPRPVSAPAPLTPGREAYPEARVEVGPLLDLGRPDSIRRALGGGRCMGSEGLHAPRPAAAPLGRRRLPRRAPSPQPCVIHPPTPQGVRRRVVPQRPAPAHTDQQRR